MKENGAHRKVRHFRKVGQGLRCGPGENFLPSSGVDRHIPLLCLNTVNRAWRMGSPIKLANVGISFALNQCIFSHM